MATKQLRPVRQRLGGRFMPKPKLNPGNPEQRPQRLSYSISSCPSPVLPGIQSFVTGACEYSLKPRRANQGESKVTAGAAVGQLTDARALKPRRDLSTFDEHGGKRFQEKKRSPTNGPLADGGLQLLRAAARRLYEAGRSRNRVGRH